MKRLLLFLTLAICQKSMSQIFYDEGPLFGIDVNLNEYVLQGSKWNKTTLTYYVYNTSNSLTSTQRATAIANAFATWQSNSVLNFMEVSTPGSADLKISWKTGDHGDGHPFQTSVLAHAFYPPTAGGSYAGQLHFNDSYQWNVNGNDYDLETVALHEIGHLLGLGHSTDINSIMYPSYLGVNHQLGSDDLQGIWALYGCPYSISGSNTICDYETYSIANLPTGLSVQWSVSNDLLTIVLGQGTSTIMVSKIDDGAATISAGIYRNGTLLATKTKSNILVGSPSLALMVNPVASDGNSGYWIASDNGNSLEIDNSVDQFYDYYKLLIDRFVNDAWVRVRTVNSYHNGNRVPALTYSGWYRVLIAGHNSCGFSDYNDLYVSVENSGGGLILSYNQSEEVLSYSIPTTDTDRKSKKDDSFIVQLWSNKNIIKSFKTTEKNGKIPMLGLKKGIYYLRIISDGKAYSGKFAK